MSFKAEIIADSTNKTGQRLTTFIVTFPRIVLAEFNTHRQFSRNSASSRAIPFKKMMKMVMENPFTPLSWQKDHSGMQGTEYLNPDEIYEFKDIKHHLINNFKIKEEEEVDKELLEVLANVLVSFTGKHTLIEWWLILRDKVVECATFLFCLGVTKQLCNRLLEAFMWHTVIVTSSEWQNFFGLRAHKDAEIHIQKLAYMMLDEYNKSEPRYLKENEWHIPFGDNMNWEEIDYMTNWENNGENNGENRIEATQKLAVRIAAARCARVSYTVVGEEGKPDNYEADLKLCDRLASSGHWSALEHCARAMNDIEYNNSLSNLNIEFPELGQLQKGWCGNFRGFVQYRKTFENECRKDSRVKLISSKI